MKSITDNEIYILHFPYRFKRDYKEVMFDYAENVKIQLPENISLISPITADKIDESPLHLQCELSNVKYYNYEKINEQKWRKELKPYYINEILQDITTDYCIILDGSDTVFCDDATDIIEKFNTCDKDIIYNDNMSKTPSVVPGKYQCFYHHINGGACIGKIAALKEIYGEIAKRIPNTNIHNEYGHLEISYINHRNIISVDSDVKIFQLINNYIGLQDNKILLTKNFKKVGDDNAFYKKT